MLALAADVPPAAFDAVVTMFVLDCQSPDEVTALVQRLADGLRGDHVWLFADFSMPARGWRWLRARLLTAALHARRGE